MTKTPAGMAFFTPGENIVFNPDRTVTWSTEFEGAISVEKDGRAVAHGFLEITTGEKRRKSIVFLFCSNNLPNWDRLKEAVDTMRPDGRIEFTLAPSFVDPPVRMTFDGRSAAEVYRWSAKSNAFGKAKVPNCPFCSGHWKRKRVEL